MHGWDRRIGGWDCLQVTDAGIRTNIYSNGYILDCFYLIKYNNRIWLGAVHTTKGPDRPTSWLLLPSPPFLLSINLLFLSPSPSPFPPYYTLLLVFCPLDFYPSPCCLRYPCCCFCLFFLHPCCIHPCRNSAPISQYLSTMASGPATQSLKVCTV